MARRVIHMSALARLIIIVVTLCLLVMLAAGIAAGSAALIAFAVIFLLIAVPFLMGAFRIKLVADGPVLMRRSAFGGSEQVRLDQIERVAFAYVTGGSSVDVACADGSSLGMPSTTFPPRKVLRLLAPWCLDRPGVQMDDRTRKKLVRHRQNHH